MYQAKYLTANGSVFDSPNSCPMDMQARSELVLGERVAQAMSVWFAVYMDSIPQF